MSSENQLTDLMQTSMTKIKEMVDVNTIVGNPIFTPDGNTVIPVSRCAFGFGAGGSEFGAGHFGGGSGAGVSITPVGFLVVTPESVKMLPINPPAGNTVDRVAEMVPGIIDKAVSFFKKKED